MSTRAGQTKALLPAAVAVTLEPVDPYSHTHWHLVAFVLMAAGYWSSVLIPAGGKAERVSESNGQDLSALQLIQESFRFVA